LFAAAAAFAPLAFLPLPLPLPLPGLAPFVVPVTTSLPAPVAPSTGVATVVDEGAPMSVVSVAVELAHVVVELLEAAVTFPVVVVLPVAVELAHVIVQLLQAAVTFPVVVVLPVAVELALVIVQLLEAAVISPVVVVLPVAVELALVIVQLLQAAVTSPVVVVVELLEAALALSVVATTQLPNPPSDLKARSILFPAVPPDAVIPAGSWTTKGCVPTSVGFLSPLVVTVAAWKLFPVPVGST